MDRQVASVPRKPSAPRATPYMPAAVKEMKVTIAMIVIGTTADW
jgi:hypothetical protein